ncbi:hypothetical protein HMSSN036_23630 [Paenibacillus macerans]|nr:hypothetical protein HMSSN036_23630 [Paenibacillus macerans]
MISKYQNYFKLYGRGVSAMKKNVLVFPCGSEIGLEINRALANSIHVELFGGSSVLNHGKYVYKNFIDGLPFVDSPYFIEELNNVVDKYNIDLIYPAHDSVLLELSKRSNELKCNVVASSYETCSICRSKGKTYHLFEDKLSTPKVYSDSTTIDSYPVFLKPDIGEGARGTKIAYSKEDVDFYISKNNSLLILEYLPGKEYTIDCFTDGRGELRFVGGRERARIQGISVHTTPVSDTRFFELATIINQTFKTCRSLVFSS